MTDNELLSAVEKAEPALLAETMEMLSELPSEFEKDVYEDFSTILSMVHEKTAALSDQAKSVALGVGGTVAGGLLSSIATDLYDAAKRGLTKGRNFDRIMSANPELKKDLDRKAMMSAFNTLHKYAPEFTADPLVGGVLVRQLAEIPATSFKTVTELLGARKDFQDSRGRHFEGLAKSNPFAGEKGKVDMKQLGESAYNAMVSARNRNHPKKP